MVSCFWIFTSKILLILMSHACLVSDVVRDPSQDRFLFILIIYFRLITKISTYDILKYSITMIIALYLTCTYTCTHAYAFWISVFSLAISINNV